MTSKGFGELRRCTARPSLPCSHITWTATSEFGTYRLCEQRWFRRACASVQSRQNLRCSLIQAVSQEEPSDRQPDPWPLWMAGHAQLKVVMTECSKTQIRLTGLICDKHRFHELAKMSQSMKKPTKWNVCPAKTQISLGIRTKPDTAGFSGTQDSASRDD